MTIREYISQILAEAGAAIPENFDAEIDTRIAENLSPYEGKIQTLEGEAANSASTIEALNSEIAALKSQNYDLLMRVPDDSLAGESAESEAESDEFTIASLFENEVE